VGVPFQSRSVALDYVRSSALAFAAGQDNGVDQHGIAHAFPGVSEKDKTVLKNNPAFKIEDTVRTEAGCLTFMVPESD